MSSPKEILEFWFGELEPKDWFRGGERVDDLVRERFLAVWERAAEGKFADWTETPDGTLALVLVLDQFPRNMFRGSGRSFDSDQLARDTVNAAIDAGVDMEIHEDRRMFLYMPLMHSETMADQDRCLELVRTKFSTVNAQTELHSKAHREVIRRFGRFPYRNEALGRASTSEEEEWMAAGGYDALVKSMTPESEEAQG